MKKILLLFLVLGLGVFAVASIANAQFVIGDRVQTTAFLNVRSGPGGSLLGTQAMGAYGTITGGPGFSSSTPTSSWWNVNYDKFPDGWSVGDYLKKVPYTTSSTPSITVLYPNGGESLEFGKTYKVRWTSNNLPPDAKIEIAISSGPVYDFFSTIHSNLLNDGEEDITIVSPVRSNTYKILVVSPYQSQTEPPLARDESDSTFSIVAAQTSSGCDYNGSGFVDSVDVSLLINYIFFGGSIPASSTNPDVNLDGEANATDLAILIDYVYQGAVVPAGCISSESSDAVNLVQQAILLTNQAIWQAQGSSTDPNLPATLQLLNGIAVSLQPMVVGESQIVMDLATQFLNLSNHLLVLSPQDPNFVLLLLQQQAVLTQLKGFLSGEINQPPKITSFSGPSSVVEDTWGQWTASAFDPEGSPVTYVFNWDDPYGTSTTTFSDVVSTGTISAWHYYAQPGNYNVILSVADNDGNNTGASLPVTVTAAATSSNQKPYWNSFSGPSNLLVGQQGTWNAQATDPNGDTVYYIIRWGDNGSSTNVSGASGVTVPVNHTYFAPGNFLISASVDDYKSGTPNPASTTIKYVTVTNPTSTPNQPPVVNSFYGPTSLLTGQSGAWYANAIDPEGYNLYYVYTWGDGSTSTVNGVSGATVNSSHTYYAPNIYPVSLKVYDDHWLFASANTSVVVTNPSTSTYPTVPPTTLPIKTTPKAVPSTVTPLPLGASTLDTIQIQLLQIGAQLRSILSQLP